MNSSMSVLRSGSPKPRMMLVQWKICWWSSSGMPIMSQITCSGSGPDSSVTSSPLPSGWFSISADTSRWARSRTEASVRATTLGVKALRTMLRSRAWRGSSRAIIEPKYSATSGIWSAMVMFGYELKMSGWRLAKKTSSNFVSAQCPGPAGKPSISTSWKNVIGASRRSVANAPSRTSSSSSQNSNVPRLMSLRAISGGG